MLPCGCRVSLRCFLDLNRPQVAVIMPCVDHMPRICPRRSIRRAVNEKLARRREYEQRRLR